jgi:adenylate cyclase
VRRQEYEYPIPVDEANEILSTLCEQPLIEKTRYIAECNGLEWEIDVFEGMNEGLIVVEVELQDENQKIELPSWCGKEVSDDPRYYNVNLGKHPYKEW